MNKQSLRVVRAGGREEERRGEKRRNRLMNKNSAVSGSLVWRQ